MSQADGYIRIVTKNDVSEAERSTEHLSDTISEAMDTSSVDRMTDAMNSVGDAAVSTGQLIQANLISDVIIQGVQQMATALKDAAVFTIETADGLDKSVDKIVSATGAGAENAKQLEAIVKEIYSDNFGDGFDDIANSVAKLKQNLGELDSVTLANVTESAYALQDVFEMGVDESSRAAKAIMQNFNVSATQAYDYIAKGAQNGLDYSGELLDTISEYSVQFAKLGFTLDDMFNIMQRGAESGAFKLDTVGDAIKELSIKTIDGSDTTAEGFEAVGLNVDKMAAKFANGGEAAKVAFEETLTAIAAVSDPIKQDAAGVALFGTMWEDLGKTAVLALSDISDSAYNAVGAMNSIKETNYSSLSDSFGSLKREIDLLIEPIGESLIPVIDEAADKISEIIESGDVKEAAEDVGKFISGTLTLLLDNIDLIASGVSGVTAAVIAFKTASMLTKVSQSWQTAALQVKLFTMAQGAAELQTAATTGKLTIQEIVYATLSGKLDIATAKTALLNTTMSMNPAGMVAIAVGVLATALTGYALCASDATTQTEELSKAIDDVDRSIDDSIATGEAELTILQKKAEKYDELRKAVNLTSDEQAELKGLANDLQDVLGNEASVVNSLTGEYNDLSAAISDYIAKRRDEIALQAYENNILEIQKQYADVEADILSKKEQLDAYGDEYVYDDNGKVIGVAAWSGHAATEMQVGELKEDIKNLEADKARLEAMLDNYWDLYENRKISEYSSTTSYSSGSGTADNERAKGEALLREQENAAIALQEQYKALSEVFKQERDALKYKYDMGVIDAAEYYTQLGMLRDNYLEKDSDEWRSVNVQIKQYYDSLSEEQQKAYEKQLAEQKNAADEAAKARTEAYNEEKSQLQFKLNTNQISESKYYKELAKIRDKYLDKNSTAWRDAYLETYNYNQQIIQENKDALTQILTDASNTTLSALDKIITARDNLTSKLINFNKTFEKVTETVPETVAVKGNFTITTSEHEVETYRMGADSIEDNIRVLEEYGAMLDALKVRGADNDTMNEIIGMDVDEALEYGTKILKMSNDEWNSYFNNLEKLRQTSEDIAAAYYKNEVEILRDNFIDKLHSELSGLGADMYNVGTDVAKEFISGWNDALGTTGLSIGDLIRAVSAGTLDTAPKAAQQLVAAGTSAANAEAAKSTESITNHIPVYIGSNKVADIMIDAINGRIIQNGKNVLMT